MADNERNVGLGDPIATTSRHRPALNIDFYDPMDDILSPMSGEETPSTKFFSISTRSSTAVLTDKSEAISPDNKYSPNIVSKKTTINVRVRNVDMVQEPVANEVGNSDETDCDYTDRDCDVSPDRLISLSSHGIPTVPSNLRVRNGDTPHQGPAVQVSYPVDPSRNNPASPKVSAPDELVLPAHCPVAVPSTARVVNDCISDGQHDPVSHLQDAVFDQAPSADHIAADEVTLSPYYPATLRDDDEPSTAACGALIEPASGDLDASSMDDNLTISSSILFDSDGDANQDQEHPSGTSSNKSKTVLTSTQAKASRHSDRLTNPYSELVCGINIRHELDAAMPSTPQSVAAWNTIPETQYSSSKQASNCCIPPTLNQKRTSSAAQSSGRLAQSADVTVPRIEQVAKQVTSGSLRDNTNTDGSDKSGSGLSISNVLSPPLTNLSGNLSSRRTKRKDCHEKSRSQKVSAGSSTAGACADIADSSRCLSTSKTGRQKRSSRAGFRSSSERFDTNSSMGMGLTSKSRSQNMATISQSLRDRGSRGLESMKKRGFKLGRRKHSRRQHACEGDDLDHGEDAGSQEVPERPEYGSRFQRIGSFLRTLVHSSSQGTSGRKSRDHNMSNQDRATQSQSQTEHLEVRQPGELSLTKDGGHLTSGTAVCAESLSADQGSKASVRIAPNISGKTPEKREQPGKGPADRPRDSNKSSEGLYLFSEIARSSNDSGSFRSGRQRSSSGSRALSTDSGPTADEQCRLSRRSSTSHSRKANMSGCLHDDDTPWCNALIRRLSRMDATIVPPGPQIDISTEKEALAEEALRQEVLSKLLEEKLEGTGFEVGQRTCPPLIQTGLTPTHDLLASIHNGILTELGDLRRASRAMKIAVEKISSEDLLVFYDWWNVFDYFVSHYVILLQDIFARFIHMKIGSLAQTPLAPHILLPAVASIRGPIRTVSDKHAAVGSTDPEALVSEIVHATHDLGGPLLEFISSVDDVVAPRIESACSAADKKRLFHSVYGFVEADDMRSNVIPMTVRWMNAIQLKGWKKGLSHRGSLQVAVWQKEYYSSHVSVIVLLEAKANSVLEDELESRIGAMNERRNEWSGC